MLFILLVLPTVVLGGDGPRESPGVSATQTTVGEEGLYQGVATNMTIVDYALSQLIQDVVCPRKLVRVENFEEKVDGEPVYNFDIDLIADGRDCDPTERTCRFNFNETSYELEALAGDCQIINSTVGTTVSPTPGDPIEVAVNKTIVYQAFGQLLQDKMCPRKIVRVEEFKQKDDGGLIYSFDLVLSASDEFKGCCCCGNTEIVVVSIEDGNI